MYDKSLIAHLLPSEMIIKNYIHGDPDCNYEKYLLEFVNASDFFRAKSDGDIYQSPESEENGQCDCISTSYQLDFKLIASKTALQARSILYPSKTEIVKGVIVTSEPRNVINSWDSNDILACPGSGKTTVLIAKLKLIADKSPLKDGRGVCVLSHTNVAVSELKAKLGKSAERLLSYPNFVGTIQTFVDQYITFPFLRQFANTSIQVVSDEDYANHLYSLICKTDSKLKWFIGQQYNAFGAKRYDSVVKFMANIYTDDEGGIHLSGVNRVLAGKSTNSAISYARAIQRLLSEEGLIRYNDTYRYTLLALKKYGSSLRTLLSRRFQYVFVDEYQDCSTLQRNVLDALFSGTETIFQKIGDVRGLLSSKPVLRRITSASLGVNEPSAFKRAFLAIEEATFSNNKSSV